jgi:hypothetical protein
MFGINNQFLELSIQDFEFDLNNNKDPVKIRYNTYYIEFDTI